MIGDMAGLKQTERLFIAVRWASVPVVVILGWLHEPLSTLGTVLIAAGLILINTLAWYLNRRIAGRFGQQVLGAAALGMDTLAAAAAISFFIGDRTTAAYAGFALPVIEAAVRYALVGGLAMASVSAAGLVLAMWARLEFHGVAFSMPGYVFWVLFMTMLALAVGALVRESRERQLQVQRLSGEQARLRERHRLSRELHDTLLKTLHGLSLEAHSLRAPQPPEAVEEKARYIEEVCAKAAVDIRELIFDLRNGEEKAFRNAAEGIVAEWSVRTGIAGHVQWEGGDPVLPQRLHYDLRQALEEALLNVERHAHATGISVTVGLSERMFTLEVRDDGSGQDVHTRDETGGGIGLASMKERAEQWRGVLEFAKGDDGAALRLRIPWPPAYAVEEGIRG